jgi:hypothetical protein
MKFPSINSVSPLEVVLFVVFLLYLIFPIPTPAFLIPYVNTNLGIAVIVILAIYMLLYTTPILGVLTLIVAYELLRRSSNGLVRPKVPLVRHTPSQPRKDKEMAQLNPTKEISLEEEVVNQMAPVGQSPVLGEVLDTPFKPRQEKLEGVSAV